MNGERSSGHNLRPRREVSYSHLHINFEEVKVEHKGVEKQPAHAGVVEDATSPTISTEAVFLTALVDALENCDVAIMNVRRGIHASGNGHRSSVLGEAK